MKTRRVFRWISPAIWSAGLMVVAWTIAILIVTLGFDTPLTADSFRFERFWAILLVPAAIIVVIARGYAQRWSAPRLLVSRGQDLARGRWGFRVWLRDAAVGLRAAAVLLLAVGLMGPQSIHARDRTSLSGIDIVLTLDASLSMQAADIQPDRFAATKSVVDNFISRRPNDRIGAVIFGRDAYTLMPLTTDKDTLRSTIAELELGLIDGRGTAIGNAVATSLNRLRGSTARSKVVILLTDGDSNSGNVSPDQAAEFASVMGVKVFTILMGVSDEARVQSGMGLGGRPIFDVGNFPVNPELLQSMAERTGGEYFAVSDRQGLERSFHTILDRLEKSDIEDLGVSYGELFPAFLWPAFGLLGLELLLSTLVARRWP